MIREAYIEAPNEYFRLSEKWIIFQLVWNPFSIDRQAYICICSIPLSHLARIRPLKRRRSHHLPTRRRTAIHSTSRVDQYSDPNRLVCRTILRGNSRREFNLVLANILTSNLSSCLFYHSCSVQFSLSLLLVRGFTDQLTTSRSVLIRFSGLQTPMNVRRKESNRKVQIC